MSMAVGKYGELRLKVGGTQSPVGNINIAGGVKVRIEYEPKPNEFRVVSVIPYLLGSSNKNATNEPAEPQQRLLAWQYNSETVPTTPAGWRCFKVKQLKILANPAQVTGNLPTLVPDGQLCVRTW